MSLTIVQAGDPVLRAQARELTRAEILSKKTQQLIEEMREAMREAPGVGLAAPQIGVSLRIAVIEDREEYHTKATPQQLAERGRRPVAFHALINPKVVATANPGVEYFEGCLSVAGFMGVVPRHRKVTVEFLNQRAEPVRVEAEGWYARILQHEIDHLNGKLYIDRMHTRTFCTVENFEQHWKGMPTANVVAKLG